VASPPAEQESGVAHLRLKCVSTTVPNFLKHSKNPLTPLPYGQSRVEKSKIMPSNVDPSRSSFTWLWWDGPHTVIWKINWDLSTMAGSSEWYYQAHMRRWPSRGTEEAGGKDRASSAFATNLSFSLLAILLLVQSKYSEKSRPHQASRLLSSLD
jgi:hypothetical protein